MKIVLHNRFLKQYSKLRTKDQEKFRARRDLFLTDPHNPTLNNHPLSGKYKGYCSINITGDIRVIYKLVHENTALFVAIGSHSSLYK